MGTWNSFLSPSPRMIGRWISLFIAIFLDFLKIAAASGKIKQPTSLWRILGEYSTMMGKVSISNTQEKLEMGWIGI